jgi:hypothetical protein
MSRSGGDEFGVPPRYPLLPPADTGKLSLKVLEEPRGEDSNPPTLARASAQVRFRRGTERYSEAQVGTKPGKTASR